MVVVIREDRELLAELGRLGRDIAQLGMRIMDGSASAQEQQHYGERFSALGVRLTRRAKAMGVAVIEGEVVGDDDEEPLRLPPHTVEYSGDLSALDWEP